VFGAQDGTLEADAGRNAWEIHRADRRKGDHPDVCVSPHSPHYLPQIVAYYKVGFWDRSEPLCIIHFYHNNFRRCAIMDKHMAVRIFLYYCLTSDSNHIIQALAPKYFNTRFLRVFVENVPFLVEKLGLKVLPCVVSFIKGVSKDRYV